MEGSKCAASQGVGLTLVWRQRRERGNGGAVFERVWVTRRSAYCIVALAFAWLLAGCAQDSGISPSPTATEATQMPTVDGGQLPDDSTVTPSPTPQRPQPTATYTPPPEPEPTSTLESTATPTLEPTVVPEPTQTPRLTETPPPAPTIEPVPPPTETPEPTATYTPTPEPLYTPNGVEYLAGIDGDFKYAESLDGSVRVEGPHHIADEDMIRYLDRGYYTYEFVADFFEDEDRYPMLIAISPDNTKYAINILVIRAENVLRTDHFVWPIENHIDLDLQRRKYLHDGLTHEWVHFRKSTLRHVNQPPTQEFWAVYLGNASIFNQLYGRADSFNLSSCEECEFYDVYFDTEGKLNSNADRAIAFASGFDDPDLTRYNWAVGMQLKLEEEFGFGFNEFKEIRKIMDSKVRQSNLVGDVYEVTPQDYLNAAEQIREGTVETFHTPDGVEYVRGTDGAFKYLESVDENVRVEGPHHIADDLMQSYLDRTHQANAFVADFFDFVPAIGIRFTISPDGTHYIMGDLSGARSDFYPFDIHSHILHDDHDSIVHEFTHVWAEFKYIQSRAPTIEFWAQYLGNASVFVRTGGDIEDYSLKNCSDCIRHDSYYDETGNLREQAKPHMSLSPELDSNAWGFGRQLTLEEDGFKYSDFQELARLLNAKYNDIGRPLQREDYESAAKLIRSTKETSSAPTPTAEPVETFHTSGGVEYVSGIDGDIKYVESLDGSVRVEGPHHIADDLMQTYLDRTHQANAFVADFFDFVPAIGIRFTISPDGTHYIMGDLSGARSDFYPFHIESHSNAQSHDGIVHEFTHIWENKYIRPSALTNEFWAQYLGNASVFVRHGGDIENFSLKNCNDCIRHNYYYGGEGILTDVAKQHMSLSPELDSTAWGFGRQLTLEEDGFEYADFRELARMLNDKYSSTGRPLQPEDYEAAARLIE